MKKLDKKIEEEIAKKKMKPKSYYLVLSVLYFISVVIAILFALFLASFIFFALKSSGTNQFLAFGYQGLLPYLQSVPWFLILALIILVILIEIFGKKIDLVSKKPLIYSMAAVIIIVVGTGAIFAETSFHTNLLDRASENRLPIGRELYEKYGSFREKDLIVAEIIEINEERLLVESQEKQFEIKLTENILPQHQIDFFVNQKIVIFGEIKDKVIEAKGIRPFDGPKPRYKGKNLNFEPMTTNIRINSI